MRDGSIRTSNPLAFTINPGGWESIATQAAQPFASGSAIVTCQNRDALSSISIQALFSFHDAAGQKVGEAAVIPDPVGDILIDQRLGERLGFSAVNNTSSSMSCSVTVRDRSATRVGNTRSFTLSNRGGRVSNFVDELLGSSLPSGFVGKVTLSCGVMVGGDLYAPSYFGLDDPSGIGLRFSGSLFSTVRFSGARASKHVLPQIADGRFPDGSYYVTAIHVLSGNDRATCQLQFRGLSPQFTLRDGSPRTENPLLFSLNSADWQLISTTGLQTFSSGYAVLECDNSVSAQAVYSFFSANGQKIGEAAVVSDRLPGGQIILDQRQGERFGLAIANNGTSSSNCSLEVRDSNASLVTTASFAIPSRTTLTTFVDEIVNSPLPSGFLGRASVSCNATDIYPIGLRFTGSLFSTMRLGICEVGCRERP